MKNLKITLSLLALTVMVWSCGSNNSTVSTSEAQEVSSTEGSIAIPVKTNTSVLTWIGSKPAGKHNGTISIVEGNINVENNTITGGNFTFDINSLAVLDIPADNENNGKLKGHLMSADFFDAANFPTASFEITGVKAFNATELESDKEEFATDFTPATLSEVLVENPTHFISGNLTMRGVTKNITIPASVSLNNGNIKAVANFNIDRTEWKLMYGDEASAVDKAKDQFIYNTVNVGFEIEAGEETLSQAH